MDNLSNECLNELVKFGEIDWVINNYVDWSMKNLDSSIIDLYKPYLNYIWETDVVSNECVKKEKLRNIRWHWYAYEVCTRHWRSHGLDSISYSTFEEKLDYDSTFKYHNLYETTINNSSKTIYGDKKIIRGDKKILALFDKYDKCNRSKMSNELLPIEAIIRPDALVPDNRKVVADYNPFWLCKNEPEWVIKHRPELMVKYDPGRLIREDIHTAYRADPHLVMVVNPYWVAKHHFDDILEMRPDLLELLYPKCMDYSLDKLKLILNEHKSTYLMVATLNMEKCNNV